MDAFSAAALKFTATYGFAPTPRQVRDFLNTPCTGYVNEHSQIVHDGDTEA